MIERHNHTQKREIIQLKEIKWNIFVKEGRLKRYRDRIKHITKTESNNTSKTGSSKKWKNILQQSVENDKWSTEYKGNKTV